MNSQDTFPVSYKNTGWAILVTFVAWAIFYTLYRILFTFVVAAYAKYDPSFATGIGALILLVFGTNILGILSAVIVTLKIFPRANQTGMFYGISSLIIILGGYSIIKEFTRYDSSWFVVILNVVIILASITVVRFLLLSGNVLEEK